MNTTSALFTDLIGKELIEFDDSSFKTSDGCKYIIEHDQDCCEVTTLVDFQFTGNMLYNEINFAQEDDGCQHYPEDIAEKLKAKQCTGGTLTKFELATKNGGHLTIYYNVESNGYYSESMSFYKVDNDK